MNKKRIQGYVLAALIVVLIAVAYYYWRGPGTSASPVVAADVNFVPLDVQEPHLRLDLLENLQKLEYTGTHRNIFSAIPPPVAATPAEKAREEHRFVGPHQPPPPPPFQPPVQFFGTATMTQSGRKVAFFTSGDDVLVVQEGSVFLNLYRLVEIGNDTALVQEISTGREATVPMVQPDTSEQPSN
jgi:hypothetical protein